MIPAALYLIALLASPDADVRVTISAAGEIDIADVVTALAEKSGLTVERPPGQLKLPALGLAGALTIDLLKQSLGSEMTLALEKNALVIHIPDSLLQPGQREALQARLVDLSQRAANELRRRESRYGMHARPSYRPNDPERPTVCLVHGLNSDSTVFLHMIGPLEQAGFGVVVYDFPFNRHLDETAQAFARDWKAFRDQSRDRRPWAIVAHSMGALLARWYVEADPSYAKDVSELVMIAPVNQGSDVAGAQTILQVIQGIQSLNNQKERAFAHLSDGLGAAADDMRPGSRFLQELNRHTRRAGVKYHILAGDTALLSPTARQQVEVQLMRLKSIKGVLGGLVRIAGGDLVKGLDELTDGLGDGCVSVSCTKLPGVADHQTIHANHLELIRAPLLYPDPGPVASMPFILKWLGVGEPALGR